MQSYSIALSLLVVSATHIVSAGDWQTRQSNMHKRHAQTKISKPHHAQPKKQSVVALPQPTPLHAKQPDSVPVPETHQTSMPILEASAQQPLLRPTTPDGLPASAQGYDEHSEEQATPDIGLVADLSDAGRVIAAVAEIAAKYMDAGPIDSAAFTNEVTALQSRTSGAGTKKLTEILQVPEQLQEPDFGWLDFDNLNMNASLRSFWLRYFTQLKGPRPAGLYNHSIATIADKLMQANTSDLDAFIQQLMALQLRIPDAASRKEVQTIIDASRALQQPDATWDMYNALPKDSPANPLWQRYMTRLRLLSSTSK